jgi:hypothetical protein
MAFPLSAAAALMLGFGPSIHLVALEKRIQSVHVPDFSGAKSHDCLDPSIRIQALRTARPDCQNTT